MNGRRKNIQSQNSDRLNPQINPPVTGALTPIPNYFVDKYGNLWNGEYHIHKGGQFCKGIHKNDIDIMSVDDFLRPHWQFEQFQINRETRNDKVNWNGTPFNWQYNTYYDASG